MFTHPVAIRSPQEPFSRGRHCPAGFTRPHYKNSVVIVQVAAAAKCLSYRGCRVRCSQSRAKNQPGIPYAVFVFTSRKAAPESCPTAQSHFAIRVHGIGRPAVSFAALVVKTSHGRAIARQRTHRRVARKPPFNRFEWTIEPNGNPAIFEQPSNCPAAQRPRLPARRRREPRTRRSARGF